jgi:hypothetical protein
MLHRFSGPCSLILLLQIAGAPHAAGQNAQSFARWRAAHDAPCRSNFRIEITEDDLMGRFREAKRATSSEGCESPMSARHERLITESARSHTSGTTADPVLDELLGLGAEGLAIAVARQEVLEILREPSTCSAWYADAEPDPARKFASLHYEADSTGNGTVLPQHDSALGFYFVEPYVARAQQNVGAGSKITLNSRGAFFVSRAPSELSSHAGFALPAVWHALHVGDYDGGSLNARVATLLHEYAHIVGLLPVDSGRPRSAQLSTQNTEAVLLRCHKQIESSRNRSILLPASFARLERALQSH